MANSIQAGAGLVQASTGLVPLGLNLVEAKATLRNNVSTMKVKMAALHKTRNVVKHEFQRYWIPRDRMIVLWLKEVEKINDQVEMLTTRFSESEKKIISNILPQFDLNQKINGECTNIDRAIQEGKEWEKALVNRKTDRILKLDAPVNITNIPALMKKLDQLLEYLKIDCYNSIKVHGETGTGKRVLIQHLNNHFASSNKMFDIVICLPALEYRNYEKYSSIEAGIQDAIVRRLGLDIGGTKDEKVIASKLHRELNDAKYLLLLDDVIERTIKLETIGIPTNKKGSKIVYATSKNVSPFGQCFGIKMERLSEGDSWQLFENILVNENDTILEGEISGIAYEVAKWCDGHFTLIRKVAKLFRSKKTPTTWENCYNSLSEPATKGDIYMKALKNFWHLSYEGLEENQKICFLFSLLYPEEYKIPIDCLFDCWAANDLLGNDVTGEDILESLLSMDLFNEHSNKQYITIDKICRVAAMNILQKHEKFKCLVVQQDAENCNWTEWEDKHWISLANSKIKVLPTTVNCSELTTLFLQENSHLQDISSSFFDKMKELIVLNLYKARFEVVLPMRNLQKLKVLYVNGCATLKKLPFEIEGPDSMLEVLDIRGFIISEIPHDIEKLMHLRRLLVSISEGGTLSRLLISKLSSLKELIIDVKADVVQYNEVIKDTIEKIDTLEKLNTLKFCFKYDTIDVIQVRRKTLKVFIPNHGNLELIWRKLGNLNSKKLKVYIGFQMTSNLEIPKNFYKYASFVLSCDNISTEPVIEEVLSKVKALIVMKDNSVEHLDNIRISPNGMHHIHHCLVQRCNKIETLMQTSGFSKLETLILNECSQLKALFLNNVVQNTMSIKHLEIRDCSAIEEINILSSSGGNILPKLTTLLLYDLPMLKKICSNNEWPSMTNLEIHKCPKLKELPLNEKNAKKLCNIRVERTWWKNLGLGVEIKQKFEQCCEFSD